MKFLAAIILLVAAGVSADDKNCDAEYIVSRCLQTETAKIGACATTDYNCLCAAYQAVATCYNNCPNDDRAPAAHSQVTANCRNVTTTTATRLATASASSAGASSSAGVATNLNAPPPTSAGFVAGSATPTGGSSAGAVHKVGGLAVAAGIAGALAIL